MLTITLRLIIATLKRYWLIALGAAFAFSWFHRNFDLFIGDYVRGVTCCDAAGFIHFSSTPNPWNLTGVRPFGYPLFLALFRNLGALIGSSPGSHSWLAAALYAQLAIWLVSCSILFFVLRHSDRNYRYGFLGLALALPALSSYSALTLPDSLATSMFCISAASIWLLTTAKRFLWLWALLTYLPLGFTASMRPNFLAIVAITGILSLIALVWRGVGERWSVLKIVSIVAMALVMFFVATVPTVGKAVLNCHRQYGKICIVDPTIFDSATAWSMRSSLTSPRVAFFRGTQLSTDDALFKNLGSQCEARLGAPGKEGSSYVWLARCYLSEPTTAALVLFKKVVAAFDNFHLNSYVTDTTSHYEYWLNKIFSLGCFLGFIFAFYICLRDVLAGTPFSNVHLVMAICFVLIQINFHIEARYFFPTYPVFFLAFLRGLSRVFERGWWQRLTLAVACMFFAGLSLTYTREWDRADCAYMYGRVPNESRVKSYWSDCAPPSKQPN